MKRARSSGASGVRICMLSTGHSPTDDRIYYKEARSLAKHFGRVYVVYPKIGGNPPSDPGVVFFGFAKRRGPFRRFSDILAVYRLGLEIQADIYHCHEPESLVAGVLLRQKTGAKLIFDSHEMYGAVVAWRFPRFAWGLVQRCYQFVEGVLVRRCDAAVAASWATAEYLQSLLGTDHVALLLNVPVAEVFGEQPGRRWDEETVLVHDGYLTFARGLKTMVQATELVGRRHKVVFKILGDVFGKEREWLDAYVVRHRLRGIVVRTGWLPYEQVGRELASCHIGLIGLQYTPNNVLTSSNKVFNYMFYGLPFVGPAFRLSKIKLSQEEQCGLLADSADPKSYASAICHLIEDRTRASRMAENALRASRCRYRWEHMEPVLLRLYENLLADTRET